MHFSMKNLKRKSTCSNLKGLLTSNIRTLCAISINLYVGSNGLHGPGLKDLLPIFLASSANPSLFVWKYEKNFIILLLYVDDIIITSNDPYSISTLIQQLAKEFAMKDLGPLHYFLGLEVYRSRDTLFLSQTKICS